MKKYNNFLSELGGWVKYFLGNALIFLYIWVVISSIAAAIVLINMFAAGGIPWWIALFAAIQLILWIWYDKISDIVFLMFFIADTFVLRCYNPDISGFWPVSSLFGW